MILSCGDAHFRGVSFKMIRYELLSNWVAFTQNTDLKHKQNEITNRSVVGIVRILDLRKWLCTILLKSLQWLFSLR